VDMTKFVPAAADGRMQLGIANFNADIKGYTNSIGDRKEN